ncbi:MAG TPA: SAM-dependent methyltransferase [Burkholderiaceae bacterium]|nr:SAM-dependent methyltransferase [Burkholderiaceae bacterium]
MSSTGHLHLIPVGLGNTDPRQWLPPATQEVAQQLRVYIAENAKTARAFLKQVGTAHVIADITMHELERQPAPDQIRRWLEPLATGTDIGLVSEAGCPAIADPGAQVVDMAHHLGYRVVPHVGPSSLLLGLMASGLNGQQFAFHGYAPRQAPARARQLKTWEAASRRHRQTQMFIETPYRNAALYDALVQNLQDSTRLCIARALTTADEWIATRSVRAWREGPRPELARMPALFLFLAD